ncbi:MAG: tetratricopeptide repeat protein, partial [Bacteroidota bacterium]
MFRVPLLTLLALTAAVRAQPCPDLASARAHLDASRPAEAQAVLEPIVDAHEACADGRFLLGQSLLAQGEWDAAADQLAEAIDLRDDVSEY